MLSRGGGTAISGGNAGARKRRAKTEREWPLPPLLYSFFFCPAAFLSLQPQRTQQPAGVEQSMLPASSLYDSSLSLSLSLTSPLAVSLFLNSETNGSLREKEIRESAPTPPWRRLCCRLDSPFIAPYFLLFLFPVSTTFLDPHTLLSSPSAFRFPRLSKAPSMNDSSSTLEIGRRSVKSRLSHYCGRKRGKAEGGRKPSDRPTHGRRRSGHAAGIGPWVRPSFLTGKPGAFA